MTPFLAAHGQVGQRHSEIQETQYLFSKRASRNRVLFHQKSRKSIQKTLRQFFGDFLGEDFLDGQGTNNYTTAEREGVRIADFGFRIGDCGLNPSSSRRDFAAAGGERQRWTRRA